MIVGSGRRYDIIFDELASETPSPWLNIPLNSHYFSLIMDDVVEMSIGGKVGGML